MRRLLATPIVFAVVATAGTGCASHVPSGGGKSPDSRTHGGLTDQEFQVAVRVAHEEADKAARSITSATATIGSGTVTDSNTGHRCTSGTELHIKVIGDFNIAHGAAAVTTGMDYQPNDDAVHAMLITADPTTGFACLISIHVGEVKPDPGATLLFKG